MHADLRIFSYLDWKQDKNTTKNTVQPFSKQRQSQPSVQQKNAFSCLYLC